MPSTIGRRLLIGLSLCHSIVAKTIHGEDLFVCWIFYVSRALMYEIVHTYTVVIYVAMLLYEQHCLLAMLVCMRAQTPQGATEHDLQRKLFRDYNTNVLPRTGIEPVAVHVTMYPQSLHAIEASTQTISMLAFLELTWRDVSLTWDPRVFDNVTSITVKIKNIWVPDVALLKSFHKPSDIIVPKDNVVIDSSGKMSMWPYGLLKIPCALSFWKYPFDSQTCNYTYSSWSQTNSRIRLNARSELLTSELLTLFYSENGEWKLVRTRTILEAVTDGQYEFDQVTFQFTFERKCLFTMMNVVLPVLLVSSLNMFCFLLPHNSGERVTLSVSVFLTLAIYMTVVTKYLPHTSDEISMFSLCVDLQLAASCLTVMVTAANLRVNVIAPSSRSCCESGPGVTLPAVRKYSYSAPPQECSFNNGPGSRLVRSVDKLCFACSTLFFLTLIAAYCSVVLA